jgi:CelD/BcsL family acetyltransferase involved in cellulose biosynthesis
MLDQAMGNGALIYQVLTRLSEVSAIAAEWDSLLQSTSCNRAFSSSAWYLNACLHDPLIEPHVTIARRDSDLVGVLPLALTDDGRTVAFPSHISDYNDIVARHDGSDVHEGLLTHAISSSSGCRKIVLARLRHDSNCVRALDEMKHVSVVEQSAREDTACFRVRLQATYDDYLGTRSAIFRKKLKLAQHKAERFSLAIRELEPEWFCPERLPEAFLDLHLKRLGNRSYFQAPAAQAFVNAALPALFLERRLRAFALFEGERMLAVDLLMVGPDSLCAWNGGFLPEAARLSPGKLLLAAEIKQAFDTGLVEYDFLRGSHEYKSSWANDCRYVRRLELNTAQ